MAQTEAYQTGYEHGLQVPANPANGDQAWSDFRAQREVAEADSAEYIAGHMAGQKAGNSTN